VPFLQSLRRPFDAAYRTGGGSFLHLDVLMDMVLAGLLLFAAIDAYAPRQDLFWKPLSLADPLGLATRSKLDRIVAAPEKCLAFLREQGVDFAPATQRPPERRCTIETPIRLGEPRLSPPGPIMDCPVALSFELWRRQSAAPQSRRLLGTDLARIDHFGTYACRNIRGSDRQSEHATAKAIDIAGFRFADGRRITVARDWRDAGASAAFLAAVQRDACRIFHTVLSPDYNAAHADHLHLDTGRFRICR
jgi:hypothetical protein